MNNVDVDIPDIIVPVGRFQGKSLKYAVINSDPFYIEFIEERGKHVIYKQLIHYWEKVIERHGPWYGNTFVGTGKTQWVFKDNLTVYTNDHTGQIYEEV